MNIQTSKAGRHYLIWDADRLEQPQPTHFSADYWAAQDKLVRQAQGRGNAYFLQTDTPEQWVLRHSRRGGLVSKFNEDAYLWTGAENTRVFREFRLLAKMAAAGLPVPKPVAAQVIRKGAFYRGDLITVAFDDSETMADHLARRPWAQTRWQALGQTIAWFHQQGIYHHDLNARNVLIDCDGHLVLIDFDKSGYRKPGAWQQANLARLKRSLDKIHREQQLLKYTEHNWQTLLDAYKNYAR